VPSGLSGEASATKTPESFSTLNTASD
jgi:hypothetical protein